MAIYLLSDSMLNNQMDGTRLSKKCDVTVDCRGGGTIKGMYTHISSRIALHMTTLFYMLVQTIVQIKRQMMYYVN